MAANTSKFSGMVDSAKSRSTPTRGTAGQVSIRPKAPPLVMHKLRIVGLPPREPTTTTTTTVAPTTTTTTTFLATTGLLLVGDSDPLYNNTYQLQIGTINEYPWYAIPAETIPPGKHQIAYYNIGGIESYRLMYQPPGSPTFHSVKSDGNLKNPFGTYTTGATATQLG